MPRKKKKESTVELGYAEDIEPEDWETLAPHFFPSKIGGTPAWLVHQPLPQDLSCGVCSKPMVFLLQVYAPLSPPAPGASEETFHRTIFLFICPDPECCTPNKSTNLKVYRSQCPRQNDFYPSEPLDPDLTLGTDLTKIEGLSLLETLGVCVVCGGPGKDHCDKCDKESYCSEYHREWHWKKQHHHECGKTPEQLEAIHRQQQKERKGPASTPKTNGLNFPVFELVTEKEQYSLKNEEERPESERLAEFTEFMKKSGLDDKENTAAAGDSDELDEFQAKLDKAFKNFTRRVGANPEQVLRYDRGGKDGPLWASPSPLVPDSIPKCLCGATRDFEFQIMPRLLSVLDLDAFGKSIDFGTIVIYTCGQSCALGGKGYVEEFVWKQDFA